MLAEQALQSIFTLSAYTCSKHTLLLQPNVHTKKQHV
jgi:hypothetical protein